MPSAPLTDTDSLEPGDVVTIASLMREGRWWTRFACVLEVTWSDTIYVLQLKMRPDERDWRHIELDPDRHIVCKLEPEEWPQGVVAMRMKHIALGHIKLDQRD